MYSFRHLELGQLEARRKSIQSNDPLKACFVASGIGCMYKIDVKVPQRFWGVRTLVLPELNLFLNEKWSLRSRLENSVEDTMGLEFEKGQRTSEAFVPYVFDGLRM